MHKIITSSDVKGKFIKLNQDETLNIIKNGKTEIEVIKGLIYKTRYKYLVQLVSKKGIYKVLKVFYNEKCINKYQEGDFIKAKLIENRDTEIALILENKYKTNYLWYKK